MEIKRFSQEVLSFDMTSMVDMMLLLLIFFMLVSTLSPPEGIKVELPRSARSGELPPSPILVITLTDKETLYLQGERVSWDKLEVKLRDNLPLDKVYLRADRNVRLQPMVRLMDILHRLGIEKINLATMGVEE